MNHDAAYWATRNLHGMGWVDAERARLGLPEMGWDVGEEGELAVPEGMRRPTRWIQRDDHGGLLVPPPRFDPPGGTVTVTSGMPGLIFSFDVADQPPNGLISALKSMFVGYNPFDPSEPADWPTERVAQAEPIRAWKRADLAVCHAPDVPAEVHFEGIGIATHYGPDATAYHPGYDDHGDHAAPDPTGGCRQCGFWAKSDRGEIDDCSGIATLEVELFGTVVEHERGWRASRQRVLCVWVDHDCARCCDPNAKATGFWVDSADNLSPRCAKCMPLGLVSLADVASLLGCEIRWADD